VLNIEFKRGISLFALLIFGITLGFGQEVVTAERYLELVSNTYAGVRDYEATINIRSGNAQMAGIISVLSPAFLRIDFSRPAEQVILYNGNDLTIYLPDFRSVLNQPMNRRSGGPVGGPYGNGLSLLRRNFVPAFLTGPNPVPLDLGSSENVIKLRLTRRTTAEGFREIVLSINPNNRTIRRMEGRTIGDNVIVFDFTNIKLNSGIPETRFAYDTPANANTYNNFLFREVD